MKDKQAKKIAFIGNSSSGKTTASLNLMLKMRYWGHRAVHYGDAVRGISFPVENLDTSTEARLHILYKQMMKETELVQRPDCDFLICERTSLDWLFYYMWTCKNIKKDVSGAVVQIAYDHAKSYDHIFLMKDNVPYMQDGFRPKSSKIRDEVAEYYKVAFETLLKSDHVHLIESKDIGKRMLEVESIMEGIYGKDR